MRSHPQSEKLIMSQGVTEDGSTLPPVSLDDFFAALQEAGGFPAIMPELESHRGPGWRLVLPREVSNGPRAEEILEALDPLIRHRHRGVSVRSEAVQPVYIDPEDTRDEVSLARWMQLNAYGLSDGVLLLAGMPADVPFRVHQTLAPTRRVGRLSFDNVDDYAAYAHRVVEAETRPDRGPRRPFFAFTSDSSADSATRLSRRQLVDPLLARYDGRYFGQPVRILNENEASKPAFLDIVRQADQAGPSLMLCATHGLEDPGNLAHPDLGALSTFERSFIRASDFPRSGAVLSHGIAVLFACSSAGGSADRVLLPLKGWTRPPPEQADRVSALPTALLAQRRGPLAIIGHIDTIFEQAMRDVDGTRVMETPGPTLLALQELVMRLAEGYASGEALYYVTAQESIAQLVYRSLLEQWKTGVATDQAAKDALCQAWLAVHDARSWMLLGDPAVRLQGGLDDPV